MRYIGKSTTGGAVYKASAPKFNVSSKDPGSMSLSEIEREIEKLKQQRDKIGDWLIEQGRGGEAVGQSPEERDVWDRSQKLRAERTLIKDGYRPNKPKG